MQNYCQLQLCKSSCCNPGLVASCTPETMTDLPSPTQSNKNKRNWTILWLFVLHLIRTGLQITQSSCLCLGWLIFRKMNLNSTLQHSRNKKSKGWTVAIKYALSLPHPQNEETPCWLLIHQGLYKFGLGTSICSFIIHPHFKMQCKNSNAAGGFFCTILTQI